MTIKTVQLYPTAQYSVKNINKERMLLNLIRTNIHFCQCCRIPDPMQNQLYCYVLAIHNTKIILRKQVYNSIEKNKIFKNNFNKKWVRSATKNCTTLLKKIKGSKEIKKHPILIDWKA